MPVYRLMAASGHGWIENIDARGPSITAIKSDAKVWDDIEQARRAMVRANRPGKVRHQIIAEPE